MKCDHSIKLSEEQWSLKKVMFKITKRKDMRNIIPSNALVMAAYIPSIFLLYHIYLYHM